MEHRKTAIAAALLLGSLLLHVVVASVLSLLGIESSSHAEAFHQYCAIYGVAQAIALDILVVHTAFMAMRGELKLSVNE